MIAHIFKPNGSRIWRMKVRLDAESKITDKSTHASDKQVAQGKLADFVRERERESAGMIAPKAVRDGLQRSLSDHLADYVRELAKLGRDDEYVYNLERLISRAAKECHWQIPKDVSAESFRAWRDRQQKAPKTLNEYLNSFSGFLNWIVENGKLEANPLVSVKRMDTRGRQQRQRRGLTDDEVNRLLDACGDWRGVYLTALLTGLRRNELASLAWGDVHLDSPQPFLVVQASVSKHRETDTVWLHPHVLDFLRSVRPAGACLDARVFRRLPSMDEHKKILAAAGIPYKDELGRQADFHALRHTFDTNLARVGIPERLRQALMRHKTLRLTNETYTDVRLLPTAAAIKMLPAFGDSASQLASQELGASGHSVSSPVTTEVQSEVVQVPVDVEESHDLALAVTGGHEEAAGCLARTRT